MDNTTKIAELEAILENGASSVSADGTTVNYDLDQIRKQLRSLRGEDDDQKARRPVIASLNLSNAF